MDVTCLFVRVCVFVDNVAILVCGNCTNTHSMIGCHWCGLGLVDGMRTRVVRTVFGPALVL